MVSTSSAACQGVWGDSSQDEGGKSTYYERRFSAENPKSALLNVEGSVTERHIGEAVLIFAPKAYPWDQIAVQLGTDKSGKVRTMLTWRRHLVNGSGQGWIRQIIFG